MKYIELLIEFEQKNKDLKDIIIAFMSDFGFYSFLEKNNKLFAYISNSNFDLNRTKELFKKYNLNFKINTIVEKNWNEEWEKNYSPVFINDKLLIKAPFHNINKKTKYEIIIEPKMSFGTGHHETTFLMCQTLSKLNIKNFKVLDIGCGTGILSIFCSKLCAKEIDAIDIDEIACINTIENSKKNNCENINVIKGYIFSIDKKDYDLILANITLNVILQDILEYEKKLKFNGLLLLSGFYLNDLKEIITSCNNKKLRFIESNDKKKWTVAVFKKV